MQLMRDIREAVNTFNAINSWRSSQHLSAEGQQKFLSANGTLVKFMEYVWSLQEDQGNGE